MKMLFDVIYITSMESESYMLSCVLLEFTSISFLFFN